jgi:organic hydroperoxide reductase OsmC/OhrA
MKPYPHTYVVAASGAATGPVAVNAPELPQLATAAPPEFDGPGGLWSPESLLCAALADCFVLTFRGISRVAGFQWLQLECRVEGVLERVERVPQFTRFTSFATLTVPQGGDERKARELLERAERTCLVSNSVKGSRSLIAEVHAMTGESRAAHSANPSPT